jgi:hypothetical protein
VYTSLTLTRRHGKLSTGTLYVCGTQTARTFFSSSKAFFHLTNHITCQTSLEGTQHCLPGRFRRTGMRRQNQHGCLLDCSGASPTSSWTLNSLRQHVPPKRRKSPSDTFHTTGRLDYTADNLKTRGCDMSRDGVSWPS